MLSLILAIGTAQESWKKYKKEEEQFRIDDWLEIASAASAGVYGAGFMIAGTLLAAAVLVVALGYHAAYAIPGAASPQNQEAPSSAARNERPTSSAAAENSTATASSANQIPSVRAVVQHT